MNIQKILEHVNDLEDDLEEVRLTQVEAETLVESLIEAYEEANSFCPSGLADAMSNSERVRFIQDWAEVFVSPKRTK